MIVSMHSAVVYGSDNLAVVDKVSIPTTTRVYSTRASRGAAHPNKAIEAR